MGCFKTNWDQGAAQASRSLLADLVLQPGAQDPRPRGSTTRAPGAATMEGYGVPRRGGGATAEPEAVSAAAARCAMLFARPLPAARAGSSARCGNVAPLQAAGRRRAARSPRRPARRSARTPRAALNAAAGSPRTNQPRPRPRPAALRPQPPGAGGRYPEDGVGRQEQGARQGGRRRAAVPRSGGVCGAAARLHVHDRAPGHRVRGAACSAPQMQRVPCSRRLCAA